MAGTVKSILDSSGHYSLVMLRNVDPMFASADDGGLLWEVLSWKMEQEEPDACVIIQAALNSKGALFMISHEMQAFARLCNLASVLAENRLASSFVESSAVETIRRSLRATLPQYADDEGFLHMFRFIVDLGANSERFCKDLLEFHQQWVNPEVRRIRLSVFGIVNEFPLEMPHLRVAGVKFVYTCDAKCLKNGFCDNLTMKQVKEVLQKNFAIAEFAEMVLCWFHTKSHGCGPEAFKCVSVLDREVFGAVIGVRGEDRKVQVVRASSKCFDKIKQLSLKMPDCPFDYAAPSAAPANAGHASTKSAVSSLAPKIIRYENGQPIVTQDVVETPVFTENILWSKFFDTHDASQVLQEDVDKASVMVAILRLAARLPTPDVIILRGGAEKRVRVAADRDFDVGGLVIVPLVQGINRLSCRSVQAWALRASVSRAEADEASTVFIVGGSSLPALTPSALANAGSSSSSSLHVSSHDWKQSHFPWPFWLVRRCDREEDANCKLVDWKVVGVSTMTAATAAVSSEPLVDASYVTIPVLVNTKDLVRGQELIVHWLGTVPKAKPKMSKSTTWFDESSKLSKKKRIV